MVLGYLKLSINEEKCERSYHIFTGIAIKYRTRTPTAIPQTKKRRFDIALISHDRFPWCDVKTGKVFVNILSRFYRFHSSSDTKCVINWSAAVKSKNEGEKISRCFYGWFFVIRDEKVSRILDGILQHRRSIEPKESWTSSFRRFLPSGKLACKTRTIAFVSLQKLDR